MNSIHKKIMVLSLISWIIMAGFWLLMTYYNHKSISQYNSILQRYLLMNQVQNLSLTSMKSLNEYMDNPASSLLAQYQASLRKLQDAGGQLSSLRNDSNKLTLSSYANMLRSQIEEMNLAIMSVQGGRMDAAAAHFNEATKISKFISETTLDLLSQDISAYDEFYRGIIRQSTDLSSMGFWTLFMATFLLLLFSYQFAGGITKPILALTLAARDIARGNFDNPIEIKTNDEISFLAHTFNRMRVEIKNLITEIQNKVQIEKDLQNHKLLLKESELKSLQSQINPHFLFNTLNTISKWAYLEGSNETSRLIHSVAQLLRYNLRKLDSSVVLADEMNGLVEYLTIQKARFIDRIHYSIEMDETCKTFEMPSLTLQPFVENAFIHAIEPSESGGSIIIRAKDQELHVVIEIIDDGAGMPEEKIQAILSGTANPSFKGHSTGIGINNVIQRLRLFYGVEDIIRISSAPGSGTCVTLYLPKMKGGEGENHDQNLAG
ncbi:sensor histidine kinase [Ferviditalea candida]|uniref:histidine kinase n=1 Tax=Ferviditalea candida TaxID=3108399 RepID=A0ABU5ZJ99_9BACL|nr:sensor histidine kinase [Paenibacillaceae bacterium T2]